tara:strand:- start:50 stop:457 length:408 start_codon:yes stop_codon:yes gene_type:complete
MSDYKRVPTKKEKPWGTEEIWATTHHSVGKILTINGGHRLSRKYHERKNHTIRILAGHLNLEVGPHCEGGGIEAVPLSPGMAYYLPANTIHRFCASDEGTIIIEISNAGPSDTVRLEDDYKRITDIPTKAPQSDK